MHNLYYIFIIIFLIFFSLITLFFPININSKQRLLKLFKDLSQSQYKEDYIFLKYLLNNNENVNNKTFIEMGALDGIMFSNTYVFEKYLGWNGLLIEASPSNFKKLEKSGRKSKKIFTAICEKKEIEFIDGYKAVNGDPSEIMEKILKNMDKEKIIKIPCQKMTNLLTDNKFTNIFFFSLDVEGSELNVINTIDFNIINSIINIYYISKILFN